MCYIIIQPFTCYVHVYTHARRLINKQLNFPAKNSEKSHSQFQNKKNFCINDTKLRLESNLYCVFLTVKYYRQSQNRKFNTRILLHVVGVDKTQIVKKIAFLFCFVVNSNIPFVVNHIYVVYTAVLIAGILFRNISKHVLFRISNVLRKV